MEGGAFYSGGNANVNVVNDEVSGNQSFRGGVIWAGGNAMFGTLSEGFALSTAREIMTFSI